MANIFQIASRNKAYKAAKRKAEAAAKKAAQAYKAAVRKAKPIGKVGKKKGTKKFKWVKKFI